MRRKLSVRGAERCSGPLLPARTCSLYNNKPRRDGTSGGGVKGARPEIDRKRNKGGTLTVSQASSHAGWGECVTLLGVDELADRGQLVDFSVSRGAGAVGGLRRHRSPGGGETESYNHCSAALKM